MIGEIRQKNSVTLLVELLQNTQGSHSAWEFNPLYFLIMKLSTFSPLFENVWTTQLTELLMVL